MVSKKILPVIFLLAFGIVNTGQASEYYTYEQSTFTISVPKTWHKIPQQYLDAFAEQIRMQFRNNPSVNPDWAIYDCGFQKNSTDYGITPPAVIIKTDHNPKLARVLNHNLNTMSKEKVSLTYQQAAKMLSSEISQIIDSSVKNILFDKRKKMLRFSLDASDGMTHVKTLTFLYLSEDTIYHIICTTLADIYPQDEKTFLHMSNSFQVTQRQQSNPPQDINVTTNVESKEAQEKLEMNEPVTGLAQDQDRLPTMGINEKLTSQAGTLSHINYKLHNISKKSIKDGDIIQQSVEPGRYEYKISGLDTKIPILGKYSNGKLRVEKPLTVLNITSQGNIYLADVSQAGNISLISIFPKQKTVAMSWQYWLSSLDTIVLWQGFGIYE